MEKRRLTAAEADEREQELRAAGIEVEPTAVEKARAAAAKAGVPIRIIEPMPGTGTITFLTKRSQ